MPWAEGKASLTHRLARLAVGVVQPVRRLEVDAVGRVPEQTLAPVVERERDGDAARVEGHGDHVDDGLPDLADLEALVVLHVLEHDARPLDVRRRRHLVVAAAPQLRHLLRQPRVRLPRATHDRASEHEPARRRCSSR